MAHGVLEALTAREEGQAEARKRYAGTLAGDSRIVLSGEEQVYPQLALADSGAIFKYAGP